MANYTRLDESTGELIPVVKYLSGSPKQYRFDGQQGIFKLGENPILNSRNKFVTTFSFIPIAYRFFEENLFGRNKKELWVELFFVDEQDAVSSIMFNNTSAQALKKLFGELYYEDLDLTDVHLHISTVERYNSAGQTWQMAVFEYDVADAEEVRELRDLDYLIKVHRTDTLTDTCIFQIVRGAFFEHHLKVIESKKIEEVVQELIWQN